MIYVSAKEKESGLRMGLGEIAKAIDSPKAFTAKILQQLARAGLLDSVRGRSGGFTLPENRSITLADIITAIDGSRLMTGCVLGFKECSSSHPCPVHHKFKPVREYLNQNLKETSLEELKQEIEQRPAYLTYK